MCSSSENFRQIAVSLLALPVCLSCLGCSTPSEVIIGHFKELTEIARASQDDCDRMGKELTGYLNRNEGSLRRAAAEVDRVEAVDTLQIYKSSLALHEAASVCGTPGVEGFMARLSQVMFNIQ